jgi:hypothetical protein
VSRLLLALALAAGAALGQTPDTTAAKPVPRELVPDSVFAVPHKSPGTAVLLSFLLPGGGQVYTGRYWHAAVIAPAEISLGFFSVRDHMGATRALAGGDTTRYVSLRDRRNALLWWTGAVLAFSMADAYVSAQLFGFDRQMRFALGPTRAGLELDI